MHWTHIFKTKVFSTYMYIYIHYLDSCFAVKYQLTLLETFHSHV